MPEAIGIRRALKRSRYALHRMEIWAAAAVVVLAGTGSRPARADAIDPDVARIEAAGHSLKWNWTPPGRSDRYGHAETLVHAPLPAVRTQVLDYARYREFMPSRFKTSRVVGHGPDGSADLYSQILVLHGLVTLWSVTHFKPPQEVSPGTEVIEGRMLPGKGNIDDLHVIWTLRALEDGWTFSRPTCSSSRVCRRRSGRSTRS